MKTCSRCRLEKPLDLFGRQAAKRDGRAPHCKACAAAYDRGRQVTQAARLKRARKDRPQQFAQYDQTKKLRHGPAIAARAKVRKARWIEANRGRAREIWRRGNRVQSPKRCRALAERYRNDPMHRLVVKLRNRVRSALRGRGKSASTKDLLGCSVEHLRVWLEAQFQPSMGWERPHSFDIDHRWPLSWFDLSDERQLRKACHYTNLRPLAPSENRSRSNKGTPYDRQAFEEWLACL